MIQINLLPDVKVRFIRAKQLQRLTILVSLAVIAAVATVFIVLFLTVQVWQRKTIADLSRDIQSKTSALQNTPDLDRILTVQNQLKSLTALHEGKPEVVRLFTYLSQITPTSASISDVKFNFVDNNATITGQADKIESINKFVDTLKFTNYKLDPKDEAAEQFPAFTQIVLTSFSRTEELASYQIDFIFNPEIFNSINKDLILVVPNIITTRSSTEQPFTGTDSPLFKENEVEAEQ